MSVPERSSGNENSNNLPWACGTFYPYVDCNKSYRLYHLPLFVLIGKLSVLL